MVPDGNDSAWAEENPGTVFKHMKLKSTAYFFQTYPIVCKRNRRYILGNQYGFRQERFKHPASVAPSALAPSQSVLMVYVLSSSISAINLETFSEMAISRLETSLIREVQHRLRCLWKQIN
ncbi:predicted protein [Histoplasma capsulatum G186AR]|uniref:Uncharacterized protein n=1 Tax=Ajellomyces capsulatus (strain G186AR / H82 / ATCC MYA-2454 / RMSCC 2432) TaxID=447093 RepID=C0NKV5_AJECG|nr:uncharacterized protein HCBG_03785 [Histoplasma capsulatum G186AR]EEH08496.1 predicted protein [Histoplasma capsulatum G186AR]